MPVFGWLLCDPVIIYTCLFASYFYVKNDLRPYLLFFIFEFHCDLHGYMKAEDTGRTDGGRQ